MLLIDVDSTATRTKQGMKDGRPWTMTFQQITINGLLVDGFPSRLGRETTVQLERDNPQPYPVGQYVLGPDCYYFAEYDRFSFRGMRLQPVSVFLADLSRQLHVTIKPALEKAA
jgi:Helix-destabilising protein